MKLRLIARLAAVLALASVVATPLLYVTGGVMLESCKQVLLVATLVWFVAAPLMASREATAADAEG